MNAETCIIGSILSDITGRAVSLYVDAGVEPSWFADQRHAKTWAAALDIFARSRPVDLISVRMELDERKAGIDQLFLEHCVDQTPTAAHADHYLERLRGEHLKRLSVASLADLHRQAQDARIDGMDEFLAAAQDELCRIVTARQDVQPLGDIARLLIARWKAPEAHARGVPWPLRTLSRYMGDLTDELVYIVARPSVGKTALILQMLTQAAFGGLRGAFKSLESSREKIVQRMIAQVGDVDTQALRKGDGADFHWQKADKVPPKLDKIALSVCDRPATIEQLAAWAKSEIKRGAGWVAIDNLKHIQTRETFDGNTARFMHLSQRLKWLRDEIKKPVVVLHHLGREGQVAWSDDIEKDADVVLTMQTNPDRSVAASEANQMQEVRYVDLFVKKNREGGAGAVLTYEFDTRRQVFVDQEETP